MKLQVTTLKSKVLLLRFEPTENIRKNLDRDLDIVFEAPYNQPRKGISLVVVKELNFSDYKRATLFYFLQHNHPMVI